MKLIPCLMNCISFSHVCPTTDDFSVSNLARSICWIFIILMISHCIKVLKPLAIGQALSTLPGTIDHFSNWLFSFRLKLISRTDSAARLVYIKLRMSNLVVNWWLTTWKGSRVLQINHKIGNYDRSYVIRESFENKACKNRWVTSETIGKNFIEKNLVLLKIFLLAGFERCLLAGVALIGTHTKNVKNADFMI